MQKLWSDTLQLGKYTLKNRVLLSPMTRVRCDPADGVPNDLLVKYYGQRAGAGLLLTEASSWSPRGCSFPGAGDIFTKEQAQGWKKVTDQVHKKGGKLFLQIFHGGRATHPKLNKGLEPWSCSALPIQGDKITLLNKADYTTPKEMTLQDIQFTLNEFSASLKLAKSAGFDGIEIHGANGYLIDQFIRSGTNRRTDKYGGTVQKRCRFILELADLALKQFEKHQIGVRLCPVGRYNDMFDANPVETYTHLVKELDARKLGFVQFMESQERENGTAVLDNYPKAKDQIPNICKTFRPFFSGLMFANYGFNPVTGLQKIQAGECDGVSFAQLYISNPDLAERIIHGYPLNTKLDYSSFYGLLLSDKAKGYTDYPFYQAAKL